MLEVLFYVALVTALLDVAWWAFCRVSGRERTRSGTGMVLSVLARPFDHLLNLPNDVDRSMESLEADEQSRQHHESPKASIRAGDDMASKKGDGLRSAPNSPRRTHARKRPTPPLRKPTVVPLWHEERQEPSMFSAEPPRQSHGRGWALVFGGVAILLLGAMFGFLVGRSGPETGTATTTVFREATLVGAMTLGTDAFSRFSAAGMYERSPGNPQGEGIACEGSGGYSDIKQGTVVVVRDTSGVTVGTGSLERGRISPAGECVFLFGLVVPDFMDFYEVEVSSRGGILYTLRELKASGWTVELGLG